MAPRKSKSLNKQFPSFDDGFPGKVIGSSSKGRQRKRKLSDMLGSQWNKEELERFYEAYRKFGKDWKKVAAITCNRSTEMVEALYNMNRAYLSLPEGTASVVGLIAMMTDHYNVLEGSDSGRESVDASGISMKLQKRRRGKNLLSMSKEDLSQSPSLASNDGCLSLLKRGAFDGRAVGKRTPRYPVSYFYKKYDGEAYISPNHKRSKKGTEVNDYEVAHKAALVLTEASQKSSFPQASQTLYRRKGHLKLSSGRDGKGKAKLCVPTKQEYCLEDNVAGRDAVIVDYDSDATLHMEGSGTVEVHPREKRFYGKKGNAEDVENAHFDDGREACSGTEEVLNLIAMKETFDEVTNVKSEQLSPHGTRKKSKKQLFGDEASAIDALQALADLSLMMPASTTESDKMSVPEAAPANHKRDKSRQGGGKKHYSISGAEIDPPRKSKLARDSESLANYHSEKKSHLKSNASKRKQKSLPSKVIIGEEEKALINTKQGVHVSTSSKQWKSIGSPEPSVSKGEQRKTGTSIAGSTAERPATKPVILPVKQHRRKMKAHRMLIGTEIRTREKNDKDQIAKPADSALDTLERLSCCLSSPMVRRWCTFEWFYGAIDYPWFAKREFVEYLDHVGLGHIPKLTRVEWGVIRSSLGNPRRFSECFLHEEREKLKQYRESVRLHYAELCSGAKDGLPKDLARPLSVGQRVVALHPKTREVHDGSLLTVDHEKCRVQFDHPELEVEFVMDIDCMPITTLEGNSDGSKRHNVSVDKLYANPTLTGLHGQSISGGSMFLAPTDHLDNTHYMPSSKHSINNLGSIVCANSQAKAGGAEMAHAQQPIYSQPCALTHVQAREADVRALSELTRALDKKEALLMELRHANSDVLESQGGGLSNFKDSERFRKHYALVLVRLKESSDEVSSAVLRLRQRNTFPGNSVPLWLKQAGPGISNGHGEPPCSADNPSPCSEEPNSTVNEIVKGSRSKAHSIVDSAVQVMWSLKEGDDAFERISEALNCVQCWQISSDSGISLANHICKPELSLTQPPHASSSASLVHTHDTKQFPSELITSCVATFLMIQMCTERQYPPAEVAEILDSALTFLYPCCPRNLPIYKEIQLCMGRIKTQILALIPT